MLIYCVFFVSMNILMIRTEDNIVKITLNKKIEGKCNVKQEVKYVPNSNFTLEVTSEYFIVSSSWKREYSGLDLIDNFEKLPNWNTSITYKRNKGSKNEEIVNSLVYTYSHYFIQAEQPPIVNGTWTFKFSLLESYNYNPWAIEKWNESLVKNWTCSTSVSINNSASKHHGNPGTDKVEGRSKTFLGGSPESDMQWLIIMLAVIGALLLAQTSYIITDKIKVIRRKSKNKNNDKEPITPKSPKVKRGSKPQMNIADRPPLPLPADEVKKDEPGSPVPLSSVSPRPKRHHQYPSAPPVPDEDSFICRPVPFMQKECNRNRVLDSSEEGVTSPAFGRRHMDGPLLPKLPSRYKASDNSDDEIRSHGRGRRHGTRMEGPLVPKQSYKNRALQMSDEELRSPPLDRRHEGPSKQSYKCTAMDNSDDELRSPGFARRNEAPTLPKKPYKAQSLENSLEELRTPDFGRRREGPLVPKQSYRKKVLDDSDEELRTPSFARRQIEAKLGQLPPKGVSASKSFKNPIPLPRRTSSPPTLPEKPALYPGPSQDPAPPLHPKKVAAVFPSQQETGRPQDSRRFSDDEWQYEHLQPASKYLNTVDEPYS